MIHIVLYEPEIPQNTGNISRTCAVTGCALHIIKPIGFEISDRTLKRAGLDYWDKLEVYYYESYSEFTEKHGGKDMYYFSQRGKRLYSDIPLSEEIFLIFGKESVGLPRELLLENSESTVRIPMLPDRRCLNLSNSVAIAAYDLLRRTEFQGFLMEGEL